MVKDICFWQNSASIHQAPLLRQLSKQLKCDGTNVHLNLLQGLADERLKMGWNLPDYGTTVVNIGDDFRSPLEYDVETVHIFSGLGEIATNSRKLNIALKQGSRPLVLLESPRSDRPVQYLLRRLKYLLLAARYRGANLTLLPIGQNAAQFYRKHGFTSCRSFEFGYFPEISSGPFGAKSTSISAVEQQYRLIFIGSLIPLKGIDRLLKALAPLKYLDWGLNLVGEGNQKTALRKLSNELGLESKVNFVGTVGNVTVGNLLRHSDCLILPSLYDGWGAVVNESLLSGTKAIVSSQAGASGLIVSNKLGAIVDVKNTWEFTEKLRETIIGGRLDLVERSRISTWAQRTISPGSGALYLRQIIDAHVLGDGSTIPTPPWINQAEAL